MALGSGSNRRGWLIWLSSVLVGSGQSAALETAAAGDSPTSLGRSLLLRACLVKVRARIVSYAISYKPGDYPQLENIRKKLHQTGVRKSYRENLYPRRRRSFMESAVIKSVLEKLPTNELDEALSEFVVPFTAVLPDERLRRVVPLAVRGIVAGETPLITAMARSVQRAHRKLHL
jgi:hypothetical protein